ncbi:LRRGT00055 [Rattus norvegicus]|uniref:LRRGT00055 n=2 Tax=Rattus norvegicus TaxID=10116 RepID=F7F0T1_RAT|nr:LRRGT00055 [Rattus norvegicus]EDL94163.1 LRRGT00055 [Rattus norvegicus]|eukprot:NP_001041396.1 uncharacterized protein LOC498460 [Rattus norvegicus]
MQADREQVACSSGHNPGQNDVLMRPPGHSHNDFISSATPCWALLPILSPGTSDLEFLMLAQSTLQRAQATMAGTAFFFPGREEGKCRKNQQCGSTPSTVTQAWCQLFL